MAENPNLASYRRPLQSANDGGNFEDLSPRVARLESDVKEMKSDLKSIAGELADIKAAIKVLPATWQLIAVNAAMLALVISSAVGALAFARFFAQ